jgi:AcrR family transcriptional regulator
MSKSNDYEHEATRKRLLDAAGEVFGRVGFERATVREICEAAGTNIASIKYHFGGKFQLYEAVFGFWFDAAIEKFPVDLGQAEARNDRQRLRAFIFMMLSRLMGPGKPAWHGRLIAREMAEPTGVFETAIKGTIRPVLAQLVPILHGICGELPKMKFERALLSVIAQCVFYQHGRPVLERVFPAHVTNPDLEQLADHIAEFSYAGLRSLREKEVRP